MSTHRTSTPRPTREERDLFEALVVLRERYAALPVVDPRSLTSVRHVIAAANAEMRHPIAPPAVRRLGIDAN